MIKAAFFDVDGTLMSHESRSVPQSTRDAIDQLQAKGIACVVATGRQLEEMKKLPVRDIAFDSYITMNGQMCLNGKKEKLFDFPLEGEAKALLLELFESHALPVALMEEDILYLNYVSQEVCEVQYPESYITPLRRYLLWTQLSGMGSCEFLYRHTASPLRLHVLQWW